MYRNRIKANLKPDENSPKMEKPQCSPSPYDAPMFSPLNSSQRFYLPPPPPASLHYKSAPLILLIKLSQHFAAVSNWMHSDFLRLSPNKTELLVFDSFSKQVSRCIRSVTSHHLLRTWCHL